MTQQNTKAGKIKSKKNTGSIKSIYNSRKEGTSLRLTIKKHKNGALHPESTFSTVIYQRDDIEINHAKASLSDETIDDLKKKYKKYKQAIIRA